jgi:glutamate synthase domain-containing protein 2/glutamate synthase domain-containing protein 1/glutamate synthase domain-containing protein 3
MRLRGRLRPQREGLYDPSFEHDACGVGFVCHMSGHKSHDIIERGLRVLENLTHRGAAGSDPDTGDGAGFLIQTPHRFLERAAREAGIRLPEPSDYGVGMIFLPTDANRRSRCMEVFEATVAEEGQKVLGWRTVPNNPEAIGRTARRVLPDIRQVFVARARDTAAGDPFERRLFVIRRRIENALRAEGLAEFHVASLSARTLCYKGLLLAHQIKRFYSDLADPTMESALALVHQRYSTNTWPTWDLAQPFRYLCHNGEINTLRGNVNWMRAREAVMSSPLFGADLGKTFPVITPGASDSAQIDNALEFLVLAGRSLPHAMMMLIPEAWDKDRLMPEEKRAFYQYHSFLMEPWDGPASIAFTDGTKIGAVLDRNGLRPSRYVVTKDGFVVMASEVGVLEIAPENVELKGRLRPGRMFLIDTEQGRIIEDEELKHEHAARRPYGRWISEQLVTLADLPPATPIYRSDPGTRFLQQRMFGYTLEELRILLAPMAEHGEEAVGSMGNDTPLAVLSERPQLLYNYFKQVFAQVTNPAIDSTREETVMSLISTIGSEGNLLEESPEQARMIQLAHPVLTNEELERLRQIDRPHHRAVALPMTFKANGALELALRAALDRLRREAARAVRSGVNVVILSDREAGPDQIPIPSLLATAAVHHHLIREGLRTRCGLVVESGEAREMAHFALLIGYGAAAVNPYLAIETIEQLAEEGTFVGPELDPKKAVQNYLKAIGKGLLKIIAKMGISTLQSYRGAQIFEAVGVSREVVEEFFTNTASRIGGIGLGVIAREAQMRHEQAFPKQEPQAKELEVGGQYQWRRYGERHLLSPSAVHKLQHAVRTERYAVYKEFAREIDEQSRSLFTIRGMLRLKKTPEPIPLEEVEPASEIVKRFCSGAMSYGSISLEAHETLAIAMNRIGGKSNSGEGGEDSRRYARDPNGDWRRSAIKQVASGRFGVTSWYLVNADELQIKIAQGSKPGEGGQLPGHKVDRHIARVRHSTPGVGLISPPPHHDIYSIEDLAQLIHDLKNSNPGADVSVKLVAVTGVGTIAAGVSKGHAETVLIVGHDGGTGASPQTSIKHAGVPWEIGLAETQQALVLNDLRGRIRVHVDGQLRTGRDVVIGALLGAEEFGFGTIALVAVGCIMMRVCHLNTCPVGVATQDARLRERFEGKPEHAVNYFRFVAEEVREYMAQLGFRRFEDMVGRVDLLEPDPAIRHWKLPEGLDWSALLHRATGSEGVATRRIQPQDHGLERALDRELLRLCEPALERGEPVELELPIRNVNRTVGAMLGSEISRRHGEQGLPEGTIRIRFTGSAGQSFGAFLPAGVTLTLAGDANDYTGKGLSGGRLVVFPPEGSTFEPSENILVGNVVLYGATGGQAFFRGVAGERFCVRNSGALAVVEGVGDHGCEYMTGGRAVILGPVGRNFAAGMSGGIAWVLDPEGRLSALYNPGMVDLEKLEDEQYRSELRALVEAHHRLTGSRLAERLLERWEQTLPQFVQVMPRDYKRALAGIEFGDRDY